MNKEKLEEAAERLYPFIDELASKRSFIEGAKWQQERMYSEEEVYNLIKAFNKHTLLIRHLEMGNSLDVKDWFEQFKKN